MVARYCTASPKAPGGYVIIRTLFFIAAIASLPGTSHGADSQAGKPVTAISAARLYDGSGAEVINNAVVNKASVTR